MYLKKNAKSRNNELDRDLKNSKKERSGHAPVLPMGLDQLRSTTRAPYVNKIPGAGPWGANTLIIKRDRQPYLALVSLPDSVY